MSNGELLRCPQKKIQSRIADWKDIINCVKQSQHFMHTVFYKQRPINAESNILLPVVVPEFNMPPWLQNLPVLQPGELRLRLALHLAGEDRRGANWSSDGLRRLNKLCWS